MMQTQRELLRLCSASDANFLLFPSISPSPFSHHLSFRFRPTNHFSLCSAHKAWLAQLSEELTAAASSGLPPEEGPIELLPSVSSIITDAVDSTALQTAASVLLTGGFTLFLFRSLRRRAKRAKGMRFRSKSSKEEAVESLKKASSSPIKSKSRHSPDQAFLGAIIAAAFGLMLYKFTTSIEYSLNHQALSNNYSVRQITITIRTIINGICYLATFVFAFNSLGLFLYSGQLAINSFVDVPTSESRAPLNSSYSKSPPDVDSSASEDQNSDKTQK